MIGMVAIVGLNSVNAQSMSTPEINMTSITNMTNATMGGNMTGQIVGVPYLPLNRQPVCEIRFTRL